MSAMDEEVAAYAAAVRAELADVPEPDRQELLADLEEHLAEVAAESGLSTVPAGPAEEGAAGAAAEQPGARLAARLGAPAAYAAELRAAYGMDAPRRRGRSIGGLFSTAALGPSGRDAMNRAAESLAEFRPTWWLARGYVLALVLWRMEHEWTILPANVVDLLLLVLAMAGSVALGRRIRDREQAAAGEGVAGTARTVRTADAPAATGATGAVGAVGTTGRPGVARGAGTGGPGGPGAVRTAAGGGGAGRRGPLRSLLIAANVATAIGLLALPAIAGAGDDPGAISVAEPYMDRNGFDPSQVVNIYPYSRDGKPLDGVLLYDQSGAPITLTPDTQGLAIDRPCGGPPAIANSYPLRLTRLDDSGDGMPQDPAAGPGGQPSCGPATPSPVPQPRVSPPASPSASPSPSPSGTGRVSPSVSPS